MSVLGLVWAGLIAVELAVPLPPGWSANIYRLDGLIWLLFLLHFAFEFAIAPSKSRYLRTHWVTALAVVLPAFRVVRIVQVFGLLRTLSLARIVLAANRATSGAAQVFAQHQFGYVLTVVAVITLLGAAGVSFFEQGTGEAALTSYGEALWWATIVVVDGDVLVEPATFEARVIALLLRIVGVALFGYVAASIASYFVGREQAAREESRLGEMGEIRALLDEVRRLRESVEALAGRQSGKLR